MPRLSSGRAEKSREGEKDKEEKGFPGQATLLVFPLSVKLQTPHAARSFHCPPWPNREEDVCQKSNKNQ